LASVRVTRRVVVDYHSTYLSLASLFLSSMLSVHLAFNLYKRALAAMRVQTSPARCRGESRTCGTLASRSLMLPRTLGSLILAEINISAHVPRADYTERVIVIYVRFTLYTVFDRTICHFHSLSRVANIFLILIILLLLQPHCTCLSPSP